MGEALGHEAERFGAFPNTIGISGPVTSTLAADPLSECFSPNVAVEPAADMVAASKGRARKHVGQGRPTADNLLKGQ